MLRLPTFSLRDEALSYLLRLRQRHLTNYQYQSLVHTNNCSTFLFPYNEEISYVTTLQFGIRDKNDCIAAAVMLDRAPKVTSLVIKLLEAFRISMD
jgi:hypothetical protein